MKRKLNILLAVILTFAMVATAAFAVEVPGEGGSTVPQMQMIAETTGTSLDALAAGDTVTVYVKAPAAAMSGLKFNVEFNSSVFEYVSHSTANDDTQEFAMFKAGWTTPTIGLDNIASGKIGFATAFAKNITPNNEWKIFVLNLKVKDGAAAGASDIEMTGINAAYFPENSTVTSELVLQSAASVTVTVKATTGDPTTGTPTTGDPTTGNPTTGNPTTGNPTTGNPTTGNPTTGNPTTGNPTTGNPTTGNPTTGNPTTGNPTTGNPTTGNPTTGDPTTGNPTTGNPTTGNPTTGDPTQGSGSSGGSAVGGGGFVPVQTPTTTFDKTQGDVTVSADGKTATITPKDGYEIDTVTVNGVNMGNVSTLTGLKASDKIVVTFKKSFDLGAYLADLQLVARSAKTAKANVKVTVTSVKDSNGNDVDLSILEDLGYTVEYKFYRSVKKSAKYKATLSKPLTDNTYTNTTGEKGTRYFYKARIVVKDANGNVVAKTALKQCKYACRVWSK